MPKQKDSQTKKSTQSQPLENADKDPELHEILSAALSYLNESDVDSLNTEKIADQLSLSMSATLRLEKRFPDASELLKALYYQITINFKLLHQPQTLPLKELLFDGCMDYFDMLSTNKLGYSKLLKAEISAPKQALFVSNHFYDIARNILKNEPDSWQKSIILAGFPVLFHFCVSTWSEDDTLDQTKTMAALDQGLERILSMIKLNK